MDAFGLPNSSPEEKVSRKAAIQSATRYAIEVPFKVMQLSASSLDIIQHMAEQGNPNSVSDAGVGALCARTAVMGAWLNVKINCAGYEDVAYVEQTLTKCKEIVRSVNAHEAAILTIVHQKISSPS